MNQRNNPFRTLADRAKDGDLAAKNQLSQQLEPQMVRIVRQRLLHGGGTTSLDRQIFAAARRLGLRDEASSTIPEEAFILKVARSVCSLVAGNLKPERRQRVMTAETVGNFADSELQMTG